MSLVRGQMVKHPKKPDWGLGEVLEDCTSDVVRIFFSEVGVTKINLKYVAVSRSKDSAK